MQDIGRLEIFYRQTFDMIPICSSQPERSPLYDELLGIQNVEILTTKMVTKYGKMNGQGDMLELVKVLTVGSALPRLPDRHPISMVGMGHVAFGVDDIVATVEKLKKAQGTQETKIYEMPNKNRCCFCRDPEGNWLELIQRAPVQE